MENIDTQCSTLRFWAGCLWYNFSCPDIIQTAEILLDWHMLFFANEKLNCTGKKKLGLEFFCADKFPFAKL